MKGLIILKSQRLWLRALCLLLSCMTLVFPITPATALSDTAAEAEEITVASIHPVCRVRYSPHSGSTIIGCLEENTQLTVLGEHGNYYQIDCYDMTGYILKSQVSVDHEGTYRVNCKEGSSETAFFSAYSTSDALRLMGRIRDEAILYIGVRYVVGGTSARGFDCSGFTQYVLGKQGCSIQRTVDRQLQSGVIIPKEDLQCGDLVFFKYTANGQLFSHVGIYLGNNQVIHASSTRGVKIDSLDEPYYVQHYLCARRMILSDVAAVSGIPTLGATQNINSSFWKDHSQTHQSGNSFAHAFPL